MCSNCFEVEISSFSSEREWQSFDLLLTKKLGSNKMKKVEFRPDGKRDKDDVNTFTNAQDAERGGD